MKHRGSVLRVGTFVMLLAAVMMVGARPLMALETPSESTADSTPTASGDAVASSSPTAPATPSADSSPTVADSSTPPADNQTAPASQDASTQPAPTDAQDPPAEPPAATTTVNQDTAVTNEGTAVGNSGVNSATTPAGTGTPAPSGSVSASVSAGGATATGGATSDGVQQQATANVAGAGRVVIEQIALIVNIGLAAAVSGQNVASAGGGSLTVSDGGGSAAISVIDTGDVSATGLSSSTAITQVVNLLDANETTSQTASVQNLGVAIGNSGVNAALVSAGGYGSGRSAVAVTWNDVPSASVLTGSATATGDISRTTVIQVAIGTATGNGQLLITQRAVVVNFGAGFAASGLNGAGEAPDSQAVLAQAVILALLSMMSDSSGAMLVSPSGYGTGAASITTGSAVAVGNDSSTLIRQTAQGSVSGDNSAAASQQATVGNFGYALANSGANLAPGELPASGALATTLNLSDAFAGLFSLLAAPKDDATWSTTLSLGASLLAASAGFDVVEHLFGDVAGDSGVSGSQIVVRQVAGVLNILLSAALSGSNVAETNSYTGAALGEFTAASTSPLARIQVADGIGVSAAEAASGAFITTGDVTVGNRFVTVICQRINAPASVCDLGVPPNDPVDTVNISDPGAPLLAPLVVPQTGLLPSAAAPRSASTSTTALAFTGSNVLSEVVVGSVLGLVGLALLVLRGRRRVTGL